MVINLKDLSHIKFALFKAKKDTLPEKVSEEYELLYAKISDILDAELKEVKVSLITKNGYKL